MSQPVTRQELLLALRSYLDDADHVHADHADFENNAHYPSMHLSENVTVIEGEPATLGVLLTTGEEFFVTVQRA